jgi:hypothetical protein
MEGLVLALLGKYLKIPNIFFGYQPRYHMRYLGYIQLLDIWGAMLDMRMLIFGSNIKSKPGSRY